MEAVVFARFGDLIPVKLDVADNLPAWKFAMVTLLEAMEVLEYVDGTLVESEDEDLMIDAAGDCGGDGGDGPRFDYVKDKNVMALIISTLSSPTLAQVSSCRTARELWQALDHHFQKLREFTVSSLLKTLRNIEVGFSVEEYVKAVETVLCNLTGYGRVLSDQEAIEILKAKIPSELGAVQGTTLPEFYSWLLQEHAPEW